MNARPTCPACGKPLRPNAPEGLCAACLLASTVAGAATPEARDTTSSAGPAVRTFGDYELLDEIARGGMGIVHKARQVSLNRIVALKMILGGQLAGREQAQRFRAEAQAAANLRHPNIVAVHEVGEHAGQLYFSMDYLEGKNLAQVISEVGFRTSDFRRSVRWMGAVAEAVHYAHQHGILHRDLKPANIIIDQDGQPHITDFGLAKRLVVPVSGDPPAAVAGTNSASGVGPVDAEITPELTLSGQVLGSPSYLSPEQAEGKRGAVGVASDVYSLGAVLYHLLTGRPPCQGETLTALLRQVIETEPVAPRLLNPGIPRDLETVCLKCLEKAPRQRYASAQELAGELGRFLANEPIRARRTGRAEQAWRWCRRNPKLAGALGAVVLSLALGLVTTTWQMRRAQAGEMLALQRAYVSDMDLASRALAEDDIGRVHELLRRCQPAAGDGSRSTDRGSPSTLDAPRAADLRGWEWQYLWMKSRSQETARLGTRPRTVGSLAFTGDSRRLVVHEFHGDTVLYDLTTREMVPGLVQSNLSFRMGFGSTHEQVAYGLSPEIMERGEVRLWDLRRNTTVTLCDYEADYFRSFAFSPDGRWLAGAGQYGAVVWHLATGGRTMSVPYDKPCEQVLTGLVAFDPTGELLAVGDGAAGVVRLHQVPGGRVETEFRLPADNVLALAFSPDGRWLAASALVTSNAARVWALPSGEPMEFPGQRQPPWALAFDPQGEVLATGDGQLIRLWDLAHRCLLTKLIGHERSVMALAFSPDGHWLASGSSASGTDGGELLLWDVARLVRPEPADYQVLTNTGLVAFEADGRSFLALADGVVTRFDIETLRPIGPLPGYGASNASLAVSWDGRWLAHAESNGMVHLWDRTAGGARTSFCPYPGARPERGTMRILVDGRLLATRGVGKGVALHLWDTRNWQQPEPWRSLNTLGRDACTTVDASRDGRFLATGYNDGQVMLWEPSTRRRLALFHGHRQTVTEVAFSPDGRWLASAGWDGALKLWDVRQRREAGSFRGSEAPYYGVTFSPDSRRIANGGLTGSLSVVIWDVATRQHLTDLVGEGAYFFTPRFSPDGRTLAVWRYHYDVTYFWGVPAFPDGDTERGE